MGSFKLAGGALLALVAAFVIAAVVASMAIFGWGMFQRSTADFRGQTDAIERVQADGDFRIQAYDRFFELCSAVQADEGRIANMESELAQEDLSDKRRGELRIALTAVRNARAEKIATYNADARREFTVGQFRSNDLPFEIDPEEKTTCR